MKRIGCIIVVLAVVARASLAQSQPAYRTNTQIINFVLDLEQQQILEIADAMPEGRYGFVPTAGEFKTVRSFAEQLKHIAADNYLLGAGILGENPPGNTGPGESGSEAVKTKAQILAYLKDSFTYMHRAAAAIDDAKAAIPTPAISPWPNGTATRLGLAIEDCLHTWDHHGQLVEYLRMNGIVPPESRGGPEANAAQTSPVQTEAVHSAPTMSQALDFWISNAEEDVTSAADAMPGDKYSFAPSGGEFVGVRTFAQQVKHLAANNYRMAARILGRDPTPDQEAEIGPDAARSKAEILDYLRGAFVALHQAVATVTAENGLQPVLRSRIGTVQQNTRIQFAVDAITHSYDHYGQMVEYLRMNGIVPPASRKH